MKVSGFIITLAAVVQGINAVALRDAPLVDDTSLDIRAESQPVERSTEEDLLWKRKGGGGGGRGGSSGSSGGTSSGGSSSGGGGRGGLGSSSSNTGGRTTTGSGVRPSYGGGAYYGGGATQPYRSGGTTRSGIVPALLGASVLGFVAFAGIAWVYGAYTYPYTHQYWYHNATTNQNETKPVTCMCEPYIECGCDDNGNNTYFQSLIGDGSYAGLNKSIVNVAHNDTSNETRIYILGNLPNGTTADGGTDNPNGCDGLRGLVQAAGFWPVATTAFALAFLL
ncbi:hypothetical protein F4778DRAFT_749215 [Xylariomycetidae sp. FL2044]|nr:hypothetical protein F4778DRAFT_749215 [Xylariomycetidae sp. FL2044]